MSIDPILTITCAISRTELALAQLDLEDPGNYQVTKFSDGGRHWERQLVTSRYTHGARKVGRAVLAHGQVQVGIRCYGTTRAALEARVADMVNAFSQGYYTFGINIDGELWQYACWEADIEVANGDYDKFALAAHQQEYRLTMPRDPISANAPL